MKSLFRLMQCVTVIFVSSTPVIIQGATLTGTAGTVTLTCTDFTQSGFSPNTYLADRNNLGAPLPGTERINVTVTDGADTVLYTANGDFAVGNFINVANTTILYGTPPSFNPLTYRFVSIAGNGFGEQVLVTASGTCAESASSLSIDDVTQSEGTGGTTAFTFTITRSDSTLGAASVQVDTADGSAFSGSDYTAIAGQTVDLPDGAASATVNVTVNADAIDEAEETFTVNLSNPSNTSIADGTGTGTIGDDDTATISIDDVTVTEGNSGTVNATFTVSLSTPSAFTVTVTAQTADATTTAGSDYTALPPTLITFNPLETSKSVTVVVNGDTTFEPDETFFVNLSGAVNASIADNQGFGTITNDDAPLTDLAITKTAPAAALIGVPFDFTINVTNNGPDDSTGSTVTDVLPGSLTFVSATPSQGSCSGTTTVTCNLGPLASGATATITLTVTATATGPATNTATVTAADTDPAPGNSSSPATIVAASAAEIPTLAPWLLIALGFALLAIGLWKIK